MIQAIKNLPRPAQHLYEEVLTKAMSRGNTRERAQRIGWEAVKRRLTKTGEEWIAKTGAFDTIQTFTFTTNITEESISKTEDGSIQIDAVLSDTGTDKQGFAASEEHLRTWSEQLNETKPEFDTDHTLWKQVSKHIHDKEYVKKAMRAKRGIAKFVKSWVDKGALYVRLLFDKRYQNHLPKIKGLSLEATNVRRDGEIVSTQMWGGTLAVNADPQNPRAGLIMGSEAFA